MSNTTADRVIVALTATIITFALAFLVWGNDMGSRTEVALLNGTSVTASDTECDAIYEAMWRVDNEPNHTALINVAKTLDCPLDDK